MDISLNFVNRSNDTNNSEIVIFSKECRDEFRRTGGGLAGHPPFRPGRQSSLHVPLGYAGRRQHSYGNDTPQLNVQNGQMFMMSLTTSGDQLVFAGSGTSSKEVQVLNALPKGAINANIYRGGRLRSRSRPRLPRSKKPCSSSSPRSGSVLFHKSSRGPGHEFSDYFQHQYRTIIAGHRERGHRHDRRRPRLQIHAICLQSRKHRDELSCGAEEALSVTRSITTLRTKERTK